MVTEQITTKTAQLPPALQQEVLDFVEFLAHRIAPEQPTGDDPEWSAFSLAQAANGLAEETAYTKADLLEDGVKKGRRNAPSRE